MKKLLFTTIVILGLTTIPVLAQEEELPTEPGGEEMQIQIQEEDQTPPEEEVEIQIQEEETDTEQEQQSEDIKVTQENNLSFWTILLATITPALLIAVAYLLIKMANS